MSDSRPEGLSPCYYSFVSPDIAASHYFKWSYRGSGSGDYQTRFKIEIYKHSPNTSTGTPILDHSYEEYSGTERVSMNSVGYNFVEGQIYSWRLHTYNRYGQANDSSVLAKFVYDSCPGAEDLQWNSVRPVAGDVIQNTYYFQEIRDNILKVLDDYDGVPYSIRQKTSNLFSGEIVPLKKDFKDLEDVIKYIGREEGVFYQENQFDGTIKYEIRPTDPPRKWHVSDPDFSIYNYTYEGDPSSTGDLNVIQWVADALGVSDLQKIRDYIEMLLTIDPDEVDGLSFDIPSTDMYGVYNIEASSNGEQDPTIDVSWDTEAADDQQGYVHFNDLGFSDDVRFFEAEFRYGPHGAWRSTLFYRPEDLSNESYRRFPTNWQGLFNEYNLDDALFEFSITAVDYRNNASRESTIRERFSSNFKVPIGVDRYELEVQRTSLSESSYDPDGKWWLKYGGSSSSATYSLSGGEGKIWHRVRVIDKSGLQSDWAYSTSPIGFDPLDPPPKPSNFRVDGRGTSYIRFRWDGSITAEDYEMRTEPNGSLVYVGPNTVATASGLNDDTTYDFYVRARNTAGVSDWVRAGGTTFSAVKYHTWSSIHAHSWKDNWDGWRADQGVDHTYVYQGEWAGGGNHRGLWYFDYEDIRQRLEGKIILEAWIDCRRVRAGYHTPNSARFWIHDRTEEEWRDNHGGRPSISSPGATGGSHNHDYLFSLYESQWVPIPRQFIQHIRDGKATGIAIYEPDGTPYMKFDNNARIKVKYK